MKRPNNDMKKNDVQNIVGLYLLNPKYAKTIL